MPGSAAVAEREIAVDGVRVLVREAPGAGPPAVFVHGNPTHSELWLPFLRALGQRAIAFDLPGWGRSERPHPRDFDYGIGGLARFIATMLDALELGEYRLVVQDWGAIALAAAARDAARVKRLVVLNSVPLLPGYRWHWVARWIWRRRLIGEILNATLTRPALALGLRQATAGRGPVPREFVEMIWRRLDRGTKRAILCLYRSADPEALVAAGRDIDGLECPALVVWGGRDPYIEPGFGRAYAERLPGAELAELDGAGHWPWIDQPDVVELVCRFLRGEEPQRDGGGSSVG